MTTQQTLLSLRPAADLEQEIGLGSYGGTMTPLSKTQRQWQRFYAKDKHNKLAPGTWDKISSNELIDIMQFMYNHAADSPQPETCGQ